MSIFGASPNTPSSPSQPSDTPGVAEHRLFIEQGRPMPGAFIAQSKRGITGLLGGQESKEVENFWTLVAYGGGTS